MELRDWREAGEGLVQEVAKIFDETENVYDDVPFGDSKSVNIPMSLFTGRALPAGEGISICGDVGHLEGDKGEV